MFRSLAILPPSNTTVVSAADAEQQPVECQAVPGGALVLTRAPLGGDVLVDTHCPFLPTSVEFGGETTYGVFTLAESRPVSPAQSRCNPVRLERQQPAPLRRTYPLKAAGISLAATLTHSPRVASALTTQPASFRVNSSALVDGCARMATCGLCITCVVPPQDDPQPAAEWPAFACRPRVWATGVCARLPRIPARAPHPATK